MYLGGRRSFPGEPLLQALVPLMLAAALVFWLAPLLVLLLVAAGVDLGPFLRPAILATGLSAAFWMLMSYGMRIPPGYGLLYPLGALMTLYIAARSTWRGGRRVEWRGRVYGSGGTG